MGGDSAVPYYRCYSAVYGVYARLVVGRFVGWILLPKDDWYRCWLSQVILP